MKRASLLAAVLLAACSSNRDASATRPPAVIGQSAAVADTSGTSDGNVRPDTTRKSAVRSVPWPWGPFDTLYNKPIDSKYRLLLARETDSVSHAVALRVKLIDATRPEIVWDVATLPQRDYDFRVARADSTSVVLTRHGDYGQQESLKLFLDSASKKLLKQIDFWPRRGLDSIPDHDVAAALGLPDSLVRALKERYPRPGPEERWDKYLPQVMKDHPMPHSTYAEFARARPGRVEDGYDSTSEIGEMPAAFQIDSSRIWFGKTFYDGEGASGVGGAGYFDTVKSTYTFLKIPEMAAWSVSSMLAEDQIVWIGLVGHPEGMDYSGGLLRHDLKTGQTKKYPIDDVVLRVKRWNNRIYVATAGGAWVIEGDRLISRFMAEPDINGKTLLVRINP
jgi:hypothetical protein